MPASENRAKQACCFKPLTKDQKLALAELRRVLPAVEEPCRFKKKLSTVADIGTTSFNHEQCLQEANNNLLRATQALRKTLMNAEGKTVANYYQCLPEPTQPVLDLGPPPKTIWDHIREGNEALGLMAGNGVSAYYAFRNGVSAHFESKPGHSAGSAANNRYRTEIYGTEGIIALGSSEMYRHPSSLWPAGEDGKWERVVLEEWDNNPKGPAILNVETIAAELIDAVEQERDVVRSSSDRDGRAALEMIMAVHESQRLGRRVAFPMANRENPYETWLREAEKPRP